MKFKRSICANCKNHYIKGDKYCRYCGAPNGSPRYIDDMIACIYGPPFKSTHKCEKCGFTWKNSGLGADGQNWCPECGGKAPAEYSDDLWGSSNRVTPFDDRDGEW